MSLEGKLSAYDSPMRISRIFEIERGNLNKFKLYPKTLTEYMDKNSEVQDIVESGVIVGQIIKASVDNIDTISFTAESAEARTEIDDLETGTYANDGALQAVWVKAGTNEAVRELIIIKNPSEHGTTSNMSMKLNTALSNGEWEATTLALPINTTPLDMTGFAIELDHYQTHNPGQQEIMIYIEDSGAARSVFNLLADDLESWKHFNIDINAFMGTCDITDVTKIGFDMVTLRPNSFIYIDNINYLIVTGSLDIKLFDLGATLPTGDGASFDLTNDATQYTELGVNGNKSAINVALSGGQRIYQVNDFIAGRNGTTQLTIDNYYAITFNYVDENATIYGYSATDKYISGYAFNTTAENVDISQIGGVGSNNDLMFYLFSNIPAWIGPTPESGVYHLHFIDANGAQVSPGANASWVTHIENSEGRIFIITVHGGHPVTKGDYAEKILRPVFIPLGGLIEIEYNHDPTASDVTVEFELFYVFKKIEANL